MGDAMFITNDMHMDDEAAEGKVKSKCEKN